MSRLRSELALLLSTLLVLSSGSTALAQVFQALPAEITAWGVADVGPIVVGGYYANHVYPRNPSKSFASEAAVRWTPEGGIERVMESVEYVHESPMFSDVSADGSRYLLSYYNFGFYDSLFDAPTGRGIAGAGYDGSLTALSEDGSTIAGNFWPGSGDQYSFVRSPDRGENFFIPLPYPDYYEPYGNGTGNVTRDLSYDGRIAVGQTVLDEAFVWTESTGTTLLGAGPDSNAAKISNNGEWIAVTRGEIGNRELLLHHDGALTSVLSSMYSVSVNRILDDGETMAINAASERGGAEPYLWRKGEGLVTLLSILEDEMDLDMTGWNLHSISRMSSSGRYLIGEGTNPLGEYRSWLVDLASLPEPSTALLLSLGLAMTFRRRGARQ